MSYSTVMRSRTSSRDRSSRSTNRRRAAQLAYNASEMYARNLLNFLKPAIDKGELKIDWNDEVFAQSCLTHDGAVKHEPTLKALES